MELTQGNLAALYQGLRGAFLDAIKEAKLPANVKDFVMEVPSSAAEEQYPTAALLGDLEVLLDEYTELNLGQFLQRIPNTFFGRLLRIPRLNVESEQLGMYRVTLSQFGSRAATLPYRLVPQLFLAGFTTVWIDGANYWSNSHQWVGGQAWDNLDSVPLSHTGFRLVRQHLEERIGPGGQSLDLMPTHLVVGPANRTNAQMVVGLPTLAGGASNPDYDPDIKIVKWGALRAANAYDWFLCDCSDVRPIVVQNREAPSLIEKTGPEDERRFRAEQLEYKASRCFGEAIGAPWLVQAVMQGATQVTTTTQAG